MVWTATDTVFLLYAAVAVLLFKSYRQIRDALETFKDNFPKGGGPRSPMHPSPVNDGALLRRRRRSSSH